MPLGPLRAACVQPAPKSRFVVSGLLRTEIKIKIKINGNGNGNGNGNDGHRTCSSPACRRRPSSVRHRRRAGLLQGVCGAEISVGHQSLWETPEVTGIRSRRRAAFALDLASKRAEYQTTQIATLAGRAQALRRGQRDMDVALAAVRPGMAGRRRALGAMPESREPDEVGPDRER